MEPIVAARDVADGRSWRPGTLLTMLLIWSALLTGILVWLPLVRGLLEGSEYQWALASGIGGRGTGGDYWLLIAGLFFAAVLFYFGWLGARQPFHWLLLTLHGALAIVSVYVAVSAPEQLFFEGATLGVRFSLAVVGPILCSAVFLAALFWVIGDLRKPRRSAPPWIWTRANRIRVGLVIGLIPLQAILLRSWGPFGPGAAVGVFLTIWQWFILTTGLLRPVRAGRRTP